MLYTGIDLGTSAVKLILSDETGKILKTVQKAYPLLMPENGWSEQDPEEWAKAVLDGLEELLSDADAGTVRGIGCAGQMHGLVILDKDDRVIRPAILWNDGRSSRETAFLNEKIGKDTLISSTGNIAFAGFTATKIMWLLENEPWNFEKISKIMLPKDYINYVLTGVFSSDFSDASGTLLLDVEKRKWSEKMLEICHVGKEKLPDLYESYEVTGYVKKEIADRFGFTGRVAVVAGAGDNAAAAVGTGTVGEGNCNISLGTSGTVFIPSEKFVSCPGGVIHSFAHADGRYHLMGCILSAASCNKWFCKDILGTEDFSALQQNIGKETILKNRIYFLPYLMGERSPLNDTDARGVFAGMSLDTSREDMVTAVLEGVAFAIKDNVETVKSLGVMPKVSSICGGGAKSPLWREIISCVLDTELQIPESEEGPGYGAAMLAMTGCGEYRDIKECAKALVRTKPCVTPDEELVSFYLEKYEKFRTIYPALKQVFPVLRQE